MNEKTLLKARYRILALLLIGFFAVRLYVSERSTALVTDEFVHIPAGYVYLKVQRFDLNPEHPPLVKILSGLPLMILNPPLPGDPKHEKDWNRWFKFCMDFFYQAGDKARDVITWARVPIILISCLLAWLVFAWAKNAFGIAAGLFSLLLYTMEPNVFAFSRIVYTDIGASLAYLAFFYSVWRCAKLPVFRNVLLVILVASVSPLVKHSMVIILPLWVLILAGMIAAGRITVRKGLAYVALTFGISLFMLNLCYGFQSHAFNSKDLKTVAGWFHLDTDGSFINKYLDRYSIIPIPADYLHGLDAVVKHNRSGHPAYLSGQFSPKGWWYYFPAAFFFKTPIPFLLLSLFGLGWLIFQVFFRKSSSAAFLLVPIVLYLAIAMSSQINIGLRHLFPVFPFLCIASGGLFQFLWNERTVLRWFVLAPGLIMAIISLSIRYDPIEYFNEFAGGPDNGWRYLGESNIDGGQNFIKVAEFLKHAGPEKVYMYTIGVEYSLFKGADINLFLPTPMRDDFKRQFPFSYKEEYSALKPGVYLLGVCRMLDPYMENSSRSPGDLARGLSLRRFLKIQPDAKIGHVIWIYNLTPEIIDRLKLSDMYFYYFNHVQYQKSE